MSTKRAGKFVVIGIILTLFNFIIYTILARLINNNDYLWLDTIVSYIFATFLGYILHSKITWQERNPGKTSIIKFFLWNFLTALAISPFLTWLFKFLTPFYEFIHQFSTNLHLPFDYNFIESTTIFCLVTIITMLLNYLFYDKLVFGKEETTAQPTPSLNQNPKVSIIIPIYNTEKYLKKCLNSITNQSYKNLEIILIDDGSTDNSGKIADEYAKKDTRIKVIHQKNAGQSAARNRGLKIASGEYISFVDSDDEIAKTFIKDLLQPSLSSKEVSITVCGIRYKRLNQQSTENVYINHIRPIRKQESQKAYILYLLTIDGRMYSSVNKLYYAKIAKTIKFDESLNFAEDTKFVLDYLKNAKSSNINFILKPLYIYNYGTETSTIRSTATNWQNWKTQYENLKAWLGPHSSLHEKFWLHLVYLRWHISHYRSKHRLKE